MTDPARQAYLDGLLHGALLVAARKARVAWAAGDVSVMTEALQALTQAEIQAGVDLTSPTDDDLREAGRRHPNVLRCPTCGAAPGEDCTNRNGLRRANGPHGNRTPSRVLPITRSALP